MSVMNRVLVSGANGFVGRRVCAELARRQWQVAAAVRSAPSSESAQGLVTQFGVGNIDGTTDWHIALAGCSSVIHLAARAHVLNDMHADPLAAFRETNVAGTLQLAKCAARAGVRRFVFVSSVGVHGSLNRRPFTESDTPQPTEAYAVSKLEAELALRELVASSGMELVVVRPPLVYGPECPGNFLRLLKLLASGMPLPFGALRNERSFVGVDNLADFLATCVVHPKAAGQTFLVSDMEDVTLPALLRGLADGMGRKAPLFSLPPRLLGVLASVSGKAGLYEKLCGSLTVDATHARRTLEWTPPVSLAAGLRQTGQWYVHRS